MFRRIGLAGVRCSRLLLLFLRNAVLLLRWLSITLAHALQLGKEVRFGILLLLVVLKLFVEIDKLGLKPLINLRTQVLEIYQFVIVLVECLLVAVL